MYQGLYVYQDAVQVHFRDPVYKDATCTRKHVYKDFMCTRDEVYKDTFGTGITKNQVYRDALCCEQGIMCVRQQGSKCTWTICAPGT